MSNKAPILLGPLAAVILAFLAFGASAAKTTPQDVAGAPSVFCKVLKEPNPRLMGGWQVMWHRYRTKQGRTDINPVEFWLVKRENRYGLYFYRFKAEENTTYLGWRDWTINGDEIVSGTGIRFFTDGTDVFFQWENDKPTKMTPTEGGP